MTYSIEQKIKNEDELWEAVNNRETYIPNFPSRITFITSKRCNLSCRFCYHFAHKYFEKRSPLDMPVMDLRLIEKVAEELFPTLHYYETTLLGDPFLSPHLDSELKLAAEYNVFMRPTTNGTTLTESVLEKVDGRMDWLKCSFDSHIRSIYNNIRIGARFENTLGKLKRFARRRETMSPVPYFRLGIVLNDLNLETLPEYIVWAHEELGVDDVEMMGLNVDRDHLEALGVFDKAELVNEIIDRSVQIALDKKIKLRLDYTRMPKPGGDRFVCQKRSLELRRLQQEMGFIAPRNFDRMSYIMQHERNRWEIGDLGYVWSNNMRRQDVCVEFFNRPFIIENGNVEACGNCNTFLVGNLKHQNFSEIWNNELYQDIRRKMYNGTIKKDWYQACNDCICMGVTYDRGRSDHRHKHFYRVTTTAAKGEGRVDVGPTHGPVDWPQDYSLKDYLARIEEFKDYEVVTPVRGCVYLSDLEKEEGSTAIAGYGLDKVNIFTPLALSRKRYIKGLYADALSNVIYKIPTGAKKFKATIGLFDSQNRKRHILGNAPGFKGQLIMKVLLDGREAYSSGVMDSTTPARDIELELEGARFLTLLSEPDNYTETGYCWSLWSDACFEL